MYTIWKDERKLHIKKILQKFKCFYFDQLVLALPAFIVAVAKINLIKD